MAHKYRDGEKRTCPHCGQASTFSNRTSVPGAVGRAAELGQTKPVPDYRPGWTCENKRCTQRYDFNV
jgi:hypothetical protein